MGADEELKPPLTIEILDQFARAICNLRYYPGYYVDGDWVKGDWVNGDYKSFKGKTIIIYNEMEKEIIKNEKEKLIKNLENQLPKNLEKKENLENLEKLEEEINELYTTFDTQNDHSIRTNIYIKKEELEKDRNKLLKKLLTVTNSDIVKEYIDLIDLVEIATRYFQRKFLTKKKIKGENKDYLDYPDDLDEHNTKNLLKYKKGLIEQFEKVMRDNKESTKNAEKIANDYTYKVTNLDEHGDRFASSLINSNYITEKIESHYNNKLNNVDKDKNENTYNEIKEHLDDLNTLKKKAEEYLQLKFNNKLHYPKQLSDDQVKALLKHKKYSIEHFKQLIKNLNEEKEEPRTLDDVKLEEYDYNTKIFNDAIEKIETSEKDPNYEFAEYPKYELLTVLQSIKNESEIEYQQIIKKNSSLLNNLFKNFPDKDLQVYTGYSRVSFGVDDLSVENTKKNLELMRNIINDIKRPIWSSLNKTVKKVLGQNRGGRRSTRKRKKTIRKKRKNKKRTRRFR